MKQLLLIGHDANRAGAQLLLLNLMRLLHERGYTLRLLLGEGGPLLDDYRALATVVVWPIEKPYVIGPLADKVLGKLGFWEQQYRHQQQKQVTYVQQALHLDTVDLVLVNTVTSANWFNQLPIRAQTPVVTFVHELAMSVGIYTKPQQLAALLKRTNHLLAVSKATADYYIHVHGFDAHRVSLYTYVDTEMLQTRLAAARQNPNPYEALGLPADALLVGGCGNAEWRKGNDLFVTLARQVVGRIGDMPVHFVWVGMPKGPLYNDLLLDVQKAGMADRVHFIEPTPQVLDYLSRFEVFLLCSREDPYPLVMFEAGLSGIPVVCFADAGGAPELVEDDGGFVVPYLDLDTMSERIIMLLQQPALRQKMGKRLAEKIVERHPARQSIDTLIAIFDQLTAPSSNSM